MTERLLDIVSLAAFALGALTFSTLALFYWSERWRGKRTQGAALPAFTLVSAIAFLSTLLSQTAIPWAGGVWMGIAISVPGSLARALLPPLTLHLVMETCADRPHSPGWSRLLLVFYAAGGAAVLVLVLEAAGLATGWAPPLERAPAVSLTTASALGLLFLAPFGSRARAAGRPQLWWTRALLLLMAACALGSLANLRYVDQLADYLLLALFCVCLYYRERLVFFDVLMKRGVFLSLGLAALAAAVVLVTWPLLALPDAAFPWLYVFIFGWLAGPVAYRAVTRAVDRLWLRRPYSAVEAEREFIRAIQSASTGTELQERASRSLAGIFQAPVEVCLDGAPGCDSEQAEGSLSADVRHDAGSQGLIRLAPRLSGIPYLSDDRRLLHVLAGALGMVLENVHFRAERRRQEEREQQLRLLASRAELRALRAQINPHFLFNALSAIAGLAQSQPELAGETIDRLAQVFRYALRVSDQEWTSLGEEVEFIEAYLRIEQARFGDRLRVEFDVDPAAGRIAIPALSIQPLIENAIRHGISAREQAGTVGLRAALDTGRLRIEVFDDGPGFPPAFSLQGPGEGHGLRNVAERLRGYYGGSATLSWESAANRTRVILTFPQPSASRQAAGEPG